MMKIKNLKTYLLIILMLVFFKGVAQHNTFSFSYTPAITKLSIKNFPDRNLRTWSIYDESKKNNMPAFGFNLGFLYTRFIGEFSIGIGILYAELRQQSGIYYQWKGLSSYPDNYAGTNYVMTYKGAEFPIAFSYLIKSKNRIRLEFELGLSFNTMLEFVIQDYIVEKKSGLYRQGCCTSTIAEEEDKVKILKYILNNNIQEMMRIGTWIGFKVDYSIYKNLSISIMPTFKYYSKSLKQADNLFSLDADALLFGTQLNLNLKF